MAKTTDGFRVTGPGVDKLYPMPGQALSASITAASRAATEATYYVRADKDGKVIGRSERDPDGFVRTWRL